MLKWFLIVVGVLVLLAIAYRIYYGQVVNPGVADEIRMNPQGDRAGLVAILTFPDSREIPVNYLREGAQVFLGADGRWWREFRHPGADVTLLIRGETLSGRAVVELDDQDRIDDVFSRLRPNVPAWLPDWLNGKLVIITVSGGDHGSGID
jgi:hypothetical protein